MRTSEKSKLVNCLHFKIASFVIFTTLILFGLYSVYQFYLYQNKFMDIEKESSELLGQALNSSLEIAMINGDIEGIQQSIEAISRNQNIVRVFLLNSAMEIKASSEKENIGVMRKQTDEGCRNCHESPEGGRLTNAITTEDEEVLRVVVPIKNRPECFRCHGTEKRLNGLLVLDRSLEPIHAEFYSHIKRAGIVACISVLGMMLVFRWYIKKLILSRVTYLESLARRVVNNELGLDIELSGRDELTSLASSFNNMKDSLRLSIEKIDNHRNYLTNLLNNLIDGILIINDNNKIVFFNHSVAEVLEIDPLLIKTGESVEQMLERTKPLSRIVDLIHEARQKVADVKSVIRVSTADGKGKHLGIHAGNLVLPPRREPEVIVIIRNITAIITLEKQIFQSEKLATIGRLAAGVAHEINNPMASILTCAEGLLRSNGNGKDNVSTGEYLEIIKNSARRCKMITQKLLDYSVTSNLKKEWVDLEEIINESLSLLHFEASKKNVSVIVQREGVIPMIRGSRDSLVQVFVNLILNGIQAVDGNGRVEIFVRANEHSLDIFVNDNGIGISAENLARVFEPFFTTKPVGMGTGLGLSVCEGIIRQHSGKVTIAESRKGHTSIMVSLPLTSVERRKSSA